ncbi:MAG: TonB-dependent receptor [Acidobacteria bacterium]|nr:TonB-dependent receptor [Acidobacteriota bacterium]
MTNTASVRVRAFGTPTTFIRRLVIGALSLTVLSSVSAAQTGSAITGVVRDSTGLVLPGVTIEASSPALIEGSRVVVSDAQGIYRIVDLRPGVYRVTFTLQGFRSLVREGVVLTSAFTATVNADLEVGAVEETVTVTGAAPVVDTQNVAAREVFTRDMVEALPIARTTGVWAALIPAMRQPPTTDAGATGGIDVGATQSERSQAEISVHGGTSDIRVVRDGMEAMRGVYSTNRVDTQEITVQMGGNPAEAETGGVRINIVPREGANTLFGTFELDGTAETLQGNNIDDELRARGVGRTPYVKQGYNVGAGVGGPIRRNRVWFFGSYRKWGAQLWLPAKYFNATQGTPFYTPDLSRPGHSNDYYQSITSRVTWAATERQKFNFSYEENDNCNCVIRLIALNRAPEATGDHHYDVRVPQVNWQYAASNRLLIESGFAWYRGRGHSDPVEGVLPDHIAIRELSTNFFYNARADNIGGTGAYTRQRSMRNNLTQRLNVSYVTGSHNFKTGVWIQQWPNFAEYFVNGGMLQNFRNGVPVSVVLYASPSHTRTMAHNIGVYAQDQWTVGQLTLNLGLRYDSYGGYAREVIAPAGPFVPERRFAKTDDLVDLKDLNARMGAAYDVFGNGRTAVKGFVGRFIVGGEIADLPAQPALAVVTSATRTWNDRNGDYVPQESELGPLSNNRFGSPRPESLTVDRAVRYGWGNRAHTWQGILSIDHEIVQGFGVQLAYYRTWWGNQNFTENRLVAAADFDEYCITAPVDPRLPRQVSGSQICGLYDVKPSKFGQVDNFQALAGDRRKRVFDGIDLNMSGRFANGAMLGGGIALGNTVIDDCGAAVDNPAQGVVGSTTLRFCRETFSWSDDVQFKINGAYPLPWNLRTSFVFQSVPGFPISATYVVTSAIAAPSLGRGLSAGANATVEVELIEPNTVFEDRTNMLDLRFSRRFTAGRTNITGNLDLANVFNANTPQHLNTQYGPQWLRVTNAMSARLVRFGVQVGF